MSKFRSFLGVAALFSATLCLVPTLASAAGGGSGGGGGSTKVIEARITGYVTAIDYQSMTITVGASYYGNGAIKVDSSTNISLDNVNCDFSQIQIGQWAEVRYAVSTRVATKLTCLTI